MVEFGLAKSIGWLKNNFLVCSFSVRSMWLVPGWSKRFRVVCWWAGPLGGWALLGHPISTTSSVPYPTLCIRPFSQSGHREHWQNRQIETFFKAMSIYIFWKPIKRRVRLYAWILLAVVHFVISVIWIELTLTNCGQTISASIEKWITYTESTLNYL